MVFYILKERIIVYEIYLQAVFMFDPFCAIHFTSCILLAFAPVVVLTVCIHIRIDGDTLKSYTTYWPPQRWQEYEPILNYCRDNGVRLVACGTPPEVTETRVFVY